MHFHSILLHIECDIRHTQKIISEKLLDYITIVPTIDNEIIDFECRVDPHHMPENRFVTSLNQGLGFKSAYSLKRVPRPQQKLPLSYIYSTLIFQDLLQAGIIYHMHQDTASNFTATLSENTSPL